MTNIAEAPPRENLLSPSDRCDRCGVEGRVRVILIRSGLPLVFCAHHYAEQERALRPVATVTHDQRPW
jgi:hypothetical protein